MSENVKQDGEFMSSEASPVAASEPVESGRGSIKTLTHAMYALQAAGFFIGFTFIVALIMNYIKKDDAKGTMVESHLRWQRRTFWFSCLWMFIAFLTTIFFVGYIIFIANYIWVIYRVVKGWMRLNEQKPIYN